MPEFLLDTGTREGAATFAALDPFTQGYIEAMLHDLTFADLAPETLARIMRDCEQFQTANAGLLEASTELVPGSELFRYARSPLDDRRLGQLFWYARCGHGVCFTDDGDAPSLKLLQQIAERVGNVDLYRGDDGKLYL